MIPHSAYLKSIFDPYFEVSEEIWNSFAEQLKLYTFEKNEIIKEANSTENYLYIIQEGSAGLFIWRDSQPACLDLCYEKEFFGDYMSLLTKSKSPLYTMAFETTKALGIHTESLHRLYEQSQIGAQIGKIAAEQLFIHKQQQQIDLLSMTAEQRYHQLLQQHPSVILRTPQKHIASYLGITVESMSRIRKKINVK